MSGGSSWRRKFALGNTPRTRLTRVVLTTAAYILVLLAAVIGSGSMVGVGVWLYFRVKRLEGENRDLLRLTGQIEELRGQMETVRPPG